MPRYDRKAVITWLVDDVGWWDEGLLDKADTKDAAITGLCSLQSAVRRSLRHAKKSSGPADCFCPDSPVDDDQYENDAEAIRFITDAVLRRIDQKLWRK